MRIGELAARTGLAPSAIRYYEQEGLLPRVVRRSGQRVYDERALAWLVVILLARDAGFTIGEIRELVTEFPAARWRRLAERKLAEVERARTRLSEMKRLLLRLLACGCADLEACGLAIARRKRPLARRA